MHVLVIQADSRTMNPLLSQERIDAELAADREAAASEWLGVFRQSTVQHFADEDIELAVVPTRQKLAYSADHAYVGFVDPSGGRHDAMTVAIAHQTDKRQLVLDALLVQRPPFSPETVVARFSETLKGYGLRQVVGDRYAGEWVPAAFAKYGVRYEASELDKSAIYVECVPLFAETRVELLEIPALVTELRLLERRPRAGGKGDAVDHPPRGSDDLANAVCGALHLASLRPAREVRPQSIARPVEWSPHSVFSSPRSVGGPPSKVYVPPAEKVAEGYRGELALLIAERVQAEARGPEGARAVRRLDRRIAATQAQIAKVETGATA
jgi:hypothetical protein